MHITTIKLVLLTTALMLGKGGGETFADSDNDGVEDGDDLCHGSDDTVDLNADDIPDCSQTAGPNLMFNTQSSINAVTIHPNSLGTWTSMDGVGWSGSGSLRVSSTLANISPSMSVCVNVQLYEDVLEVWFNARTAWTTSAGVYVDNYQYSAVNCTGPASSQNFGSSLANAGTASPPWPTFSDEIELDSGARSVLLSFTMSTDQPWHADNILLLPRINSEGPGDPPPIN